MSIRESEPAHPEPHETPDTEAGKQWVQEKLYGLVVATGGTSCVFEWEDPTRRSAAGFLEGELEDVEGDSRIQDLR